MPEAINIRYFVRFYNAFAYTFEFASPRSCADLVYLLNLTEIEKPSQLLLMDDVKQDPEIEVEEYNFNSLIHKLIGAGLDDYAYFQRSNRSEEIHLVLVLKVKPKALNRFVEQKKLPLTPRESDLFLLLGSIESLKEILSID